MVAIFSLNTALSKRYQTTPSVLLNLLTQPFLPPAREDDIGDAVGVFE